MAKPPLVQEIGKRLNNPNNDLLTIAMRNMNTNIPPPKRSEKDILSQAQIDKRHRNFAEQASSQFYKYYDDIADCNIKDIMLLLAQHGGSVEIRGFGTFYVAIVPEKWLWKKGRPNWNGKEREQYRRAPHRRVFFKSNKLLLDMLNLDVKNQEVSTPNPNYWVDEKHFLV